MKIALASDHAGIALKSAVKEILSSAGYEAVDLGTHTEESVDYPDYAYTASRAVADRVCDCAVLVCTTGIGMSIASNKVKGVRAALCRSVNDALMARRHNDANVLVLSGAQFKDPASSPLLKEIIQTWILTGFDGGRHERRVKKIADIEEKMRS